MGNDERCCTRFRANAIFLSPASLLMEFMRSLRRSGSARERMVSYQKQRLVCDSGTYS